VDNELSNDTQQKARELARKITVAHDLDPEIQEELYGHIEDKLLAYKSGEERISDEDAFILVREHFGDAGNVKRLFWDVYQGESERGLLRNVLVAAITTLICVQGVAWMAHFASLIFAIGNPSEPPDRIAASLVAGIPLLLSCLCFWRWKRQTRRGEKVWYHSWKTRTLLALALGLFATGHVVPGFFAPLLFAVEVPSLLHLLMLNAFPPHRPLDMAIAPLAFLLANAALFAFIVWAGVRIERSSRNPFSSIGIPPLLRAAYPWAMLVILVLADLALLFLFAGIFPRTVFASVGQWLALAIRIAAVVAFCASWIWWCDAPPRSTRSAAKTALLWAGFTALYAALPALQAGFAHGETAVWMNSGAITLKLGVPGTAWWLYLAHTPYDVSYEAGRLLAMVTFTVFFAVVATHSYRIYGEANTSATAQE